MFKKSCYGTKLNVIQLLKCMHNEWKTVTASRSLNWCYSRFTCELTRQRLHAVYSEELTNCNSLTISFRQWNSSYSQSKQPRWFYFFILIAWKEMELPKGSNHQRGWVANTVHLPPTESKEIHLVWHLQPAREREREREGAKWDTLIVTSSLSYPSFTYLFDPSVPFRTEKKTVTVMLEGEQFPWHPASDEHWPPLNSPLNSLFPLLHSLPHLILSSLSYPSLTGRWHLKWRWQISFWVTLSCG